MKKLFFAFALLLAGCGSSSSDQQGQEPVNKPPQISTFTSQSIDEGQPFSLSVNASDSDGSITGYQWIQVSGPSVSLQGADDETVSFNAPIVAEDEVVRLEVTVTDNGGASSSAAVDITIVNTHLEARVTGTITLGGEPVPDVEVTFDYDDMHLETQAGSAGEYEFDLAIPLDYGSTPFMITAATGSLPLKTVGLIDELLASGMPPPQQAHGNSSVPFAGAAKTSTTESPSLNVNEVTTVEAALLQDLFDSEEAFLNNLYGSLQAYTAQYAHIDSRALLDIASFVLYLLDNEIAPPDPLNLDALQEMLVAYHQDHEDFASVLWNNYAGRVFALNASPGAFERILGDGDPATVIPVIESAPGTVRVGEWFDFSYSFEPDGALVIRNFYGEEIPGTWAQEGNGITITTEQPFNVLDSGGGCEFLSGSETWTIIQERRLAMDSVMIARDVRQTCHGELVDEYTRYHPVALYKESHFLPIVGSDLAGGTFAINIPHHDSEAHYTWGGFLLDFLENGTGQNLDTGEAFSWQVSDNTLTISLSDGGTSRIYKVQDDGQAGAGIVQIYEDAEGTTFVHHGLLFGADPSLQFEENDLISKGLRAGIDASRSARDISFVTKQFCNFHEEELRTCVHATSIDGAPFTGSASEAKWAISPEGKLMLSETTTADTYDWEADADERCDPDTNTECWVYALTVWEIIHREENRYYVRRGGGRQFERPEDNQTLPPVSGLRDLEFFDVSDPIEIPEGM